MHDTISCFTGSVGFETSLRAILRTVVFADNVPASLAHLVYREL